MDVNLGGFPGRVAVTGLHGSFVTLSIITGGTERSGMSSLK